MASIPVRRSTRLKTALIAVAALVGFGGLSSAEEVDGLTATVLKRYYLMQVDARCHLLDATTSLALKAGFLQARNTAIRNGKDMSVLGPYFDRVHAVADRTDCASPQLNAEISTANSAVGTYRAMPHLDLSAGRAGWTADRSFATKAVWRLVQYQDMPSADLALGLYGTLSGNHFAVMAHFADDAKPYSARLLVRDPRVMGSGIINPATYALSDILPLGFDDNSLSFIARASSEQQADLRPTVKTNGAGFSLTGDYVGAQGPEDAFRFDFPTAAYRAIAVLDPREDIVVAFDFQDGTRYARFEVGDFITGLSYVALPSPYS